MIFVAIASYCDPQLTYTIWDCRRRAAHPENLRFGVVDQSDMPGDMGADVRYVNVPPGQSQGLCWARSACFALYRGEDYLLQIDSHTIFEDGWDDILIAQLAALPGKPILSSFPMPYTIEGDERVPLIDRALQVMVLKDGETLHAHDPQVSFKGYRMESATPVPQIHLAGGFVFTRGTFVEEVPYDPYLHFRDEQAMMVRAWTHGWDVYAMPNVPVYHLYHDAKPKDGPTHWDRPDNAAGEIRARDRLVRLFYGDGLPTYGLGAARTLGQYAQFSGIDYARRAIER